MGRDAVRVGERCRESEALRGASISLRSLWKRERERRERDELRERWRDELRESARKGEREVEIS